MPKTFTERATVQEPFARYGESVGWRPVSTDEALALRGGESGLTFRHVLADQLLKLNPGVLSPTNVLDVIARIENVRASIEGNEDSLEWLRGQKSIYVEPEHREMNVRVIDYERVDANVFQVTDEWTHTNGKFTNRADVVFLINGIPVAIVETKAAHKPNGIDEGIAQMRRYHIETPEMVAIPQIFDVTHLIAFWYGVTWSLDRRHLFNWKDEEPGNFEKKVMRFFDRQRFLAVLRDYIAFIRKDDELTKIILRQHQVRAVEKVVERVADASKRRALIWHTQGSGKTLTMITVAHELLTRVEFGKPTVLMLVDRNELESQLFGNLQAYGIVDVEVAKNKHHLQQLLKTGYRGLVVSMIHKFDKIDKDLNTSEQIIVLVDEAHRTTSGDLGNYLMGALPNATYIGLTGTPIDRTAYGKGTFKVFGADDENGYLDKYSIAESIEDGTTLPLRYSMAPNEMQVPKEQLEEEFLDLVEAEGVSDIEDLNRILDRAVTLKAFLKSADRLEKVAKFVAEHYRANVEPLGYKAFVVAVDREACALYKQALDNYLPPAYSRVVYTPAHNDTQNLRRFYLSEEDEKRVRKDFLIPGTEPRILIVTEKLLTGFDAPILYCMYLDKPMRDHTLLQAIARVNRPYEDAGNVRKPSGFVLDFVGIFDKLEKALAFDSDVVSGVIENIDVLRERFRILIEGAEVTAYLELAGGQINDKAVERVVDQFTDKEVRNRFAKLFSEVQTLYEILSPDAFLRDYLERYQQLAVLHEIVHAAFDMTGSPVKDLMNKTEALVRRRVTAEGLTDILPLTEINEGTLEALKLDSSSDSSKIVNLARSLAVSTRQNTDQPFLIPIGDRAARILELFEDRQLSTQDALNQLEAALAEYNAARREMSERGLDVDTFSSYWILRQANLEDPDSLATQISKAFALFPDSNVNGEQRRELKAELYGLLLRHVDKTKRAEIVQQLMKARHR